MCFVKTFWFSVILAFHSTACGKCRSRVWHICRDAPRPEKNPRQSECFCRARLLPFLFFCFLFLLHVGQHGTLCPRILSVLQHPRTQAGMLLLQWCCGTRRCEGTHTQRTSNKTFRNKHKAAIYFFLQWVKWHVVTNLQRVKNFFTVYLSSMEHFSLFCIIVLGFKPANISLSNPNSRQLFPANAANDNPTVHLISTKWFAATVSH